MSSILITVPHCCWSGVEVKKHYDRNAEAAAKIIQQHLNIKNELLLGDMPRKVCDLNRPTSRHTPFRQYIGEWLNKASSTSIVLDVHSFINIQTGRIGSMFLNVQLVLLYHPSQIIDDAFIKYLKDECKINVGVAHSTLGDIRLQTIEAQRNGMTLEFNSDLTEDELAWIGLCIAHYYNTIMK